MLIYLKRIIKSGFINFWRSGVVSFSSIVVLTVTLFVIGGLYLGQAFLDFSLETIKEKVDISVSFQPYATEIEVLEVKQQLELLSTVKLVSYSSREEELVNFQARNKDNALITESLKEVFNPLGARLNIKALDPSHYESIARSLENDSALSSDGRKLIYDINYRKMDIDRFISFIDATNRLGLAFALTLIIISIFTVFSTVSLAIHVSREEITVMRLVGANNRYIHGPFIVEGIVAGLLSSLLAVLLLYPAVIWMKQVTAVFPERLDLVNYYLNHFSTLFFLTFGFGLILSVIASYLATRKYLKT